MLEDLTSPVLLDIESRSLADLTRVGGRLYWEDPSSEILCLVWFDTRMATDEAMRAGAEGSSAWGIWLPGDPIPYWAHGDRVLAAHNGTKFDRFGCERYGMRAKQWLDTAHIARRHGLPGKLDAMGTRWLGVPKDAAGSRFTKSLSQKSRAKKTLGQLREITVEILERVIAYCCSDVLILVRAWPRMRACLEALPDWEHEVVELDGEINERGICFDSELARRLLESDAILEGQALVKVMNVLGCSAEEARALTGAEQCRDFLGLPNAQKETIQDELKGALIAAEQDTPGAAEAVAVCEARLAKASIARGKLKAGLARVSADGRLRDWSVYSGAHTLRWSAQGLQPHNLPRPIKRFEKYEPADVARLAEEILTQRYADAEEINFLLRACFLPSPGNMLAVCDFSGVEARCLAWMAGDQGALDTFNSGRNPYFVMAAQIFGLRYEEMTKQRVEYNVGKIGELACGYGMGESALYEGYGPELDAAGVAAGDVIKGWRGLHAPSVAFWYQIEDAAKAAARGEIPEPVGDGLIASTGQGIQFLPGDGDDEGSIAAVLPSGHTIIYPDVHLSSEASRFRNGKPRVSLSYQGTKFRERTWGGSLVENVVQATCRHILAKAMLRVRKLSLPIVLTVHDEIVTDQARRIAKESFDALRMSMLELDPWAHGFPIGAAGFITERYCK